MNILQNEQWILKKKTGNIITDYRVQKRMIDKGPTASLEDYWPNYLCIGRFLVILR